MSKARSNPDAPSKSEIEMCWIDAWNELYEIQRAQPGCIFVLPDNSVVDINQCQAWLQDSAYAGFELNVRQGVFNGVAAALVSRTRRFSALGSVEQSFESA